MENLKISEPFHVIIIGAGISGLLIAQGLKKAGIKYSIYDSEPSLNYKNREWTLGVHFAGPDLEALLPPELHARLREAFTDPYHVLSGHEKTPIINSGTGETIKEIPHPDTLNMSRKRMRALCSEGIPVQYGRALGGLKYEGKEVIVMFEDWDEVRGNLVIGADGTRSKVRECLLGKEKAERTLCQLDLITGIVRYEDAEVARRVRSASEEVAFGYHPEGMFNMIAISNVPDPKDPTTWEFYIANSILAPPPPKNLTHDQISKKLKARCSKLAEPFKSSILEIGSDQKLYSDRIFYWMPMPWNNHHGRVTLAGDAVHPMPPYRGQGLGNSIRDCYNLVEALKMIHLDGGKWDLELEAVVEIYEEEVIERGKVETETSIMSMNMVHDWQLLMDSPFVKLGSQKISEAKVEAIPA